MKEHPSPEVKQSCQIENVDYTGTAAVAKIKWLLEAPDWKMSEINYLSLLKTENKWIIVSKVSHRESYK